MTLQERIQEDLKIAGTQKLSPIKETLKVILSELSRGKLKEVPDEKVIAVIKKLREDAVICGNFNELMIYDRYLPAMMSEQGIKDYVSLIIATEHLSGLQSVGRVMAHIKSGGLGPQVDNAIAIKYAKEFLA